MKVKLSNNYFDVVPGFIAKVDVESDANSLEEIKSKFTFKSYRQVFDPSSLRVKIEP